MKNDASETPENLARDTSEASPVSAPAPVELASDAGMVSSEPSTPAPAPVSAPAEEAKAASLLLVLAKRQSSVQQTVNFLERRGFAARIVTSLNEAVEMFTRKEANMLLLSVNFPHPKVDMLPVLMNQSFKIETIIFAEDTDRKSQGKLSNAKTKHVLFGPASGPVVLTKIRLIEREMNGEDEASKESGSRVGAARDDEGDIKISSKRSSNDDTVVLNGRANGDQKTALDQLTKSSDDNSSETGSSEGLERSGDVMVAKGQRSKMMSTEQDESGDTDSGGILSDQAQDLRAAIDQGLREASPAERPRLILPLPKSRSRGRSAEEASFGDADERMAEAQAAAENEKEKAVAKATREKEKIEAGHSRDRDRAEAAATREKDKAEAMAAREKDKAEAAEARERAKLEAAAREEEKAKAQGAKERERQQAEKAAEAAKLEAASKAASAETSSSSSTDSQAKEKAERDAKTSAQDTNSERQSAKADPASSGEAQGAKTDRALGDAAQRAAAEQESQNAKAAQAEKSKQTEAETKSALEKSAKEKAETSGASGAEELSKQNEAASLLDPIAEAPAKQPTDIEAKKRGSDRELTPQEREALPVEEKIRRCMREALAIVAGAPVFGLRQMNKYSSAALISLRSKQLTCSFIISLNYSKRTPGELFHRIEVAFFSLLRDYGAEFDAQDVYSIFLDNLDVVAGAFEASDFAVVTSTNEIEIGVVEVVTKNPVATLTPYEENMLSVSLQEIPLDEPITFSLFLHLKRNQKFIRYMKQGSTLTPPQARKLEEHRAQLLVDQQDREAYRRHFAAHAIEAAPNKRRTA